MIRVRAVSDRGVCAGSYPLEPDRLDGHPRVGWSQTDYGKFPPDCFESAGVG